MIVYYDLERSPPSFDAVAFTMWVASFRQGEHVEIRVLPGPVDGFRNDSTWPQEIAARVAMRDNVLVPILKLLPDSTVTVLEEREPPAPGSVGHGEVHIGAILMADMLRLGIRPLRTPDAPKTGITTITLRECEHWPQRNSNVDEWIKAWKLIPDCIVIRDTRIEYISIEARADLYRRARCNMFVNNGPAWLCVALDAPMLMLRPATDGIKDGFAYGRNIYRDMGVKDQLPTSPPWQRLVWEEDTCDNILAAHREFVRLNG